jgi:hypothetical protein
MSKYHLVVAIERTTTTNIRIAPELADTLVYMCRNAPPGSDMKTSQLEVNCPEATYNRLDRLDEMGFADEVSGNDGRYLVTLQTNDSFHGPGAMSDAVDSELRQLRQHAQNDQQVRQLIASHLGVSQNEVDRALSQGDLTDKVSRLVRVVNEIRAHSTIQQGNYQRLRWQSYSNAYEVTDNTLRLYTL